MVSVCGQHKNVIGIIPPFTLTCEEAEQIARKLRESMDEVVMEKKAALATAAEVSMAGLSATGGYDIFYTYYCLHVRVPQF